MYKYLVNTECEETPHYQCSAYRSTQCKGKQLVKIASEGDTEVRETSMHTCRDTSAAVMRNCEEEMCRILETEAIASMSIIPGRLWDRVCRQLEKKYPGQSR
ncbi:hypothetical protein JG687_00012775 [Phytophthora cactorum]|uniref:FLYWCH-type domain-containing protein n=1 Tax=Phytophthora cactorum TaxID=29920 RepID=A0A8T1U310_9STRA|nr:hypothetical protein PC120_g19643 [Phytophthora cactorum]KAG3050224.1 hypothetical protein PC121_g18504 [Phytophthora cactorum]KAG4044459.1 hypothetical protein PC123_g20105 [Phytophthora cactorum]KAG6952794.1 hypothetical protein JG687_00012775 [Phytophthora cactorum]